MKKKQIILITITLIVLIASATAFNLGNLLSTTDFGNVDLDKYDFNPTPQGNSIVGNLFKSDLKIYSFEKTPLGEYEEITKTLFPNIELTKYTNCRAEGEIEQNCDIVFHDLLVNESAIRTIKEKENLKTEQEIIKEMALYANELQPGDIVITQKEINDRIAELTTT